MTERVYQVVVRPRLNGDSPEALDSAFGPRHVVTLAADRIVARRRAVVEFDATVLHRGGAVPVALELIRLHQAGDCGVAVPVTELVYSFPQAALPAVPPARTTVVALFRTPPWLRVITPPTTLGRDEARRLAALVAQAALRKTLRGRGMKGEGSLRPLTARLALDPEQAADAADVVPLPSTHPALFAVAIRGRYVDAPAGAGGDTTFLSGVALTDTGLTRLRWVTAPERLPLRGGQMEHGARYVVRGAVVYPPTGRQLLLLDHVVDVDAGAARLLAVDPWTRRVVAAQPLALRCR